MPGPWLRLTAFAAAAACAAAVVSGALELGAAHRGLAALALPPLAAVVAAAWVGAPEAARPGARSVGVVPRRRDRHLAPGPPRAGGALARLGARRRRLVLPGRARSARLLARLRHPHEAADHDAAPPDRSGGDVRRGRRGAAALDVPRHDGRPGPGLRRGERAQPRARPGPRPADAPDGPPPGRRRTRDARAGTRVRARALGVLLRAAGLARERPDRGARTRRATSSTCSSTPAG